MKLPVVQRQPGMRQHILGMPATKPRASSIVLAIHHHQGIAVAFLANRYKYGAQTRAIDPDRRASTNPAPVGRRDLMALTAASLALLPTRVLADEVAVDDAPATSPTSCLSSDCPGVCTHHHHPHPPICPTQFKVLRDDILAYEFAYPVATQSGRPLPVLLSRAPERYSSAAPLTADARQRIVCQLADLKDAITISVTVRTRFLVHTRFLEHTHVSTHVLNRWAPPRGCSRVWTALHGSQRTLQPPCWSTSQPRESPQVNASR